MIILSVASRGSKVLLWGVERHAPHDECGVYIASDGEIPAVGDDVWWQAGKVYWTPANRLFRDRPLRKIGYSSSGPEMAMGVARDGIEAQRGLNDTWPGDPYP